MRVYPYFLQVKISKFGNSLAQNVMYWQYVARYALVAQLDRVPGYEPGGWRFEPSPVR